MSDTPSSPSPAPSTGGGSPMPLAQPSKRKGAIPGLPKHWQNFFGYLLLFMALPLLPLLLEALLTGSVTEQTLTLAAAMYTIGIGIASRSLALFALTVVSSIFFACLFGAVMQADHARKSVAKYNAATMNLHSDKDGQELAQTPKEEESAVIGVSRVCAWLTIGFVSICHAIERFNRHVIDRIPLFEF